MNSISIRRPTRLAKAALAIGVLVVATGCGGGGVGPNQPGGSGQLTGSGSTFVKNYIEACAPDFRKESGANVSYGAGGSGKGRADISNKTVDFAVSDTPFSEGTAPSGLIHIPVIAGPIAISYRLDGFDGELKLTRQALAGIFAGEITKWNDAQITAANPGATLPGKAISVYYRQDSSGTSGVFTGYLSAVANSLWNKGSNSDFRAAFPGKIPTSGTFQAASGSDAVSQGVQGKDGAITYAEASYASQRDLKVALIENEAGEFVAPTPEAAAKFLGTSTPNEDGIIDADYKNADEGSYNITAFAYALVYEKTAKATELKRFLEFLVSTCASNRAIALDYAPLEGAALSSSQALIARISE
jgi:phosphate transport system substrate-binding protein